MRTPLPPTPAAVTFWRGGYCDGAMVDARELVEQFLNGFSFTLGALAATGLVGLGIFVARRLIDR